ncbi:MAG: 2-oxo acid dehydrogenase subunit E2 [Proteobacteria bacterium]|nr:2-oxo acid dehydrogenase subunit E2 [Pseudomonadota bacterium]
MTVFKLPDLGEGLPDAEIVKWMIREGDTITEGDNMVEMSTAKAVVEIPVPFSGKVIKLYGGPGDVIKTGAALIEIAGGGESTPAVEPEVEVIKEAKDDSGTVVGAVVVGDEVTSEIRADASGAKASAAVRAQARKLKIDLASIAGSGPDGAITLSDLKAGGAAKAAPETAEIPGDVSISPSAKATARALDLEVSGIVPKEGRKVVTKGDVLRAAREKMAGEGSPQVLRAATSREVKAAPKVRELARAKGVDLKSVPPTGHAGNITLDDVIKSSLGAPLPAAAQPYRRPARPYEVSGKAEKLVGPRRAMAQGMAKACSEVCHTSIFDEASISAWPQGTDITVRIMRSMIAACYAEPALNAWFDGENMEKTTHLHVNLGVAVDNPKGLFVPVLKGADDLDGAALRTELNRLRGAISDASITIKEMSGATITMSNFGMFSTPLRGFVVIGWRGRCRFDRPVHYAGALCRESSLQKFTLENGKP